MNALANIENRDDFFPADFRSDENGIIFQDLNGMDISFERLKVPSGGGLSLELPGLNAEEPEQFKEVEAVILHHHPLQTYYEQEYTGANNPPDCSSLDGITGTSTPGGSCKSCMLNRFGTGKNGSKACKNRRRLFILRRGELFPILFELPTTSIRDFSTYVRNLISRRKHASGVITKLSLKKAQNSSGIVYSQVTFSYVRDLTPDECEALAPINQMVTERVHTIGYEITDEVLPEFETEPVSTEAMSYNVNPETGEVEAMAAF